MKIKLSRHAEEQHHRKRERDILFGIITNELNLACLVIDELKHIINILVEPS